MISTPTVLVLGAGASKPEGYPLGSELRKSILDWGVAGGPLRALFNHPEFEALIQKISATRLDSVDDFLESQPKYSELAKAVIAATMTLLRHNSPPWKAKPEHQWYGRLWSRLKSGCRNVSALEGSRLKIVTYNYDRSLERFLLTAAPASFPELANMTPGELSDFLQRAVPVLHLHGSFGDLDDQIAQGGDLQRFHQKSLYFEMAKTLWTVHEEGSLSAYEEAREWIAQSERLHFLGFGFHPTNLDRLTLRQIWERRGQRGWDELGGTAKGMGAAQIREACRVAGLGLNLVDLDCREYLEKQAILG